MVVLYWIVTGLIVGIVARFLVKGPHPLGCIGAIGLGILGSLVGGTILNVLSGNGMEMASSGFLGSVFGAVLLLVAARLFGSKS